MLDAEKENEDYSHEDMVDCFRSTGHSKINNLALKIFICMLDIGGEYMLVVTEI